MSSASMNPILVFALLAFTAYCWHRATRRIEK